jgi:hypothetical protein
MPFVTRDQTGAICALRTERAEHATEYLPPDHPEVTGFVEDPGRNREANGNDARAEMRQSDLDMIRVYEDLVDLLIQKNIVLLTEFPEAAQEKLLRRKRMRAMLSPISDILVVEEDGIF